MVWPKLPELYILAQNIIQKNKSEYFSQLKFLFNPIEKKWEVNYLLTRKKTPGYFRSEIPCGISSPASKMGD